jgi:hypothetical protein
MGEGSGLSGVVVPVVAGVVGILLLVGVLYMWLISLAKRVAVDVVASLGGDAAVLEIEKSANCLGVRSLGLGQIRGNGCLVLTSDEIHFRLWMPSRTTRVPLEAVTAVGTGRAFMGKATAYKHVRVTWAKGDGPDDEVAWIVRDADRWERAINAAVEKKSGRRQVL